MGSQLVKEIKVGSQVFANSTGASPKTIVFEGTNEPFANGTGIVPNTKIINGEDGKVFANAGGTGFDWNAALGLGTALAGAYTASQTKGNAPQNQPVYVPVPTEEDKGMSTGAIIGFSIAGVLALGTIIFLVAKKK